MSTWWQLMESETKTLREQLDTSQFDLGRLGEELRVANEELNLTRQEVVAQTKSKEEALAELQRFKEGNLTDEELQTLCHNLPPNKVCQFRKGCQEYQVKLFGEEVVKSEVARELRWALRQVSFAYGMDGLAEGLASAIVDNDHLKPPCKDDVVKG